MTSQANSVISGCSQPIAPQSAGRPTLSVVCPLHNEEHAVNELCERLIRVLSELPDCSEVILIDDGSTDGTAAQVAAACGEYGRVIVRGIELTRNFGKMSAIIAGLEHARGHCVIVMDGDLQHPPELIPRLLAEWRKGYPVVVATRKGQRSGGLIARVCSSWFVKLLNAVGSCRIHPRAMDYCLLDRQVVASLRQVRERPRFFRYMVAWLGYPQSTVECDVPGRAGGRPSFSFLGRIRLATDALTAFSSAPLRACTFAGIALALAGLPYALWAIYVRIFTDTFVPGWSALIVSIIILSGVQLIFLGVLGEYIARIYEEVQGRPRYVVRRVHPEPLTQRSPLVLRQSHPGPLGLRPREEAHDARGPSRYR